MNESLQNCFRFLLPVLGLDYVIKDNRSEVGIPKYNNKVLNAAMFDRDTQVYLPHSVLRGPSMAGETFGRFFFFNCDGQFCTC